MKKYIKTYKDYFGYCDDEPVICEWCNKNKAVDVHHIKFRSQKKDDTIGNLAGLCRICHNNCHKKLISSEALFKKHKQKIKAQKELEKIQELQIDDLLL